MKFALILTLFVSSSAFAIGHDIGNGEGYDPCHPDGTRFISYQIEQIDRYVQAGGALSEELLVRREYLVFVKQSKQKSSGESKSPSDDDCRFPNRAGFQPLLLNGSETQPQDI